MSYNKTNLREYGVRFLQDNTVVSILNSVCVGGQLTVYYSGEWEHIKKLDENGKALSGVVFKFTSAGGDVLYGRTNSQGLIQPDASGSFYKSYDAATDKLSGSVATSDIKSYSGVVWTAEEIAAPDGYYIST